MIRPSTPHHTRCIRRRALAVVLTGAIAGLGVLAVAPAGAQATVQDDLLGGVLDASGPALGTDVAALSARGVLAAPAGTGVRARASVPTTTITVGAATGWTVTGRGTYHAIGLGQWGALGYAIDQGWTSDQILDHYYGATVAARVSSPRVTMLLTALSDHQTAVVHDRGAARVAGDPEKRRFASLVAREVAPATYDVWGRTDATVCPSEDTDLDEAAGWVKVLSGAGPEVTFQAARPGIRDLSRLLGACEPSGTVRYYRGAIRALNNADGGDRTINVVPIEQLLRSTVAWEMSPSWADLGSGRGIEALRAQAVAARSYILAYSWYAHAQSCDNICVAYRGAASRIAGPTGGRVMHEDPRSDTAVATTAGEVRRRGSATGPIALTMYSASTGGWTAPASGLASFPLVEDAGDAYRAGQSGGNPWRNWTRTVTVASVEGRWPAIGELARITLVRNGLGTWGGRVTSVTLVGSAGKVTLPGDTFPRAMGLPSNWFQIGDGA